MKNILWLIVGVGLGFVAAHQINRTPEGKRFFEDVDSRAHEFSNAVVDGYKEREAELRAAVGEACDALSEFTAR
ncbi:hypothetical protein BH09ACT2_BH09ACT2_18800 [soil metagenome]